MGCLNWYIWSPVWKTCCWFTSFMRSFIINFSHCWWWLDAFYLSRFFCDCLCKLNFLVFPLVILVRLMICSSLFWRHQVWLRSCYLICHSCMITWYHAILRFNYWSIHWLTIILISWVWWTSSKGNRLMSSLIIDVISLYK